MKIKFNIKNSIETDLYLGFYAIYVLGGHHIEVDPDFSIEIINIETNVTIELTEKFFKVRDYKSGKKAIKFFTFNISEYGKFKISVNNYENIIVKDSILESHPCAKIFPFSMLTKMHSFLLGRSSKKVDLELIDILIQ